MRGPQTAESIWVCGWCGTTNSFSGRKSDERCLACRKHRSAPTWASTTDLGKPDDGEIREAYLNGHYAEIATAVANGLTADSDSRIIRDALRLALTAELGSMETYWGYADESTKGLAMGWVWPQQPFVTGLTLHLERDGKRAKNSVERQFGKRKMALNLEFEKALDPDAITLSVSLFYRGQRKIETRPIEIEFSRELQ